MRMPPLGWLAWLAASAAIYVALERWARSASATTMVFLAGILLQLVVPWVSWPGRS
jgi:hypothetical protein